jgi:hypothetical protein
LAVATERAVSLLEFRFAGMRLAGRGIAPLRADVVVSCWVIVRSFGMMIKKPSCGATLAAFAFSTSPLKVCQLVFQFCAVPHNQSRTCADASTVNSLIPC